MVYSSSDWGPVLCRITRYSLWGIVCRGRKRDLHTDLHALYVCWGGSLRGQSLVYFLRVSLYLWGGGNHNKHGKPMGAAMFSVPTFSWPPLSLVRAGLACWLWLKVSHPLMVSHSSWWRQVPDRFGWFPVKDDIYFTSSPSGLQSTCLYHVNLVHTHSDFYQQIWGGDKIGKLFPGCVFDFNPRGELYFTKL